MFEFTVPEGDYDYDFETRIYTWKDLVFTETKWKTAKEIIKTYREDLVPFTMVYSPK